MLPFTFDLDASDQSALPVLFFFQVGAAWKWAKPGSPHEWGGNGALSLRSRAVVLAVLEDFIATAAMSAGSGAASAAAVAGSSGLHASFKGNEDMWFIRRLVELRDRALAAAAVNTAPTATATTKAAVAALPAGVDWAALRLAPREASMRWATEELFNATAAHATAAGHGAGQAAHAVATKSVKSSSVAVLYPVAPVGVYHTMRSMEDSLRAKVLAACPEAKRLFDAKHERGEKASK